MKSKIPASPQLDFRFEAVRESRRTWRVGQLVAEAREIVEQELGDVWVEGEISNLRPASSGHVYFTLKDAEAQLPVVLFRRQAMLLRFRPEDGLQVRVRGKVSVYEQRGQLQLVADVVEPVGAGSLQLAFEQLRDRLKAEGLFEQERKRELPRFPRTVAVVTSPTGAVIRDFLNVVSRRHSALNVLVVPVAVQGDVAAGEIEAALWALNESGLAELVVLARGGGSLEDLAAFNSERVARAIVASRVPVVSAIGHETDFTIADFVADLRAPTPSAAAELVTEAQHKIEEYLGDLFHRLDRSVRFQLMHVRQSLAQLPVARAEHRMITGLHRRQQRVDDLSFRLESAMVQCVGRSRGAMAASTAALLQHDPRRKLSAARAGLLGWQSRLDHALDRKLDGERNRIQSDEDRLYRAVNVQLMVARSRFGNVQGQLQSLSPLAVLQRGYALVQDESGFVIRTTNQLAVGQKLTTRLGAGVFDSRVESLAGSDPDLE